MDYRDNLYPKIPFYMTYPMQNMYLTEMEYEKDIERMKSYYPSETKAIMKMVEDRLDELEYEGSRIYDEEPDRQMIALEAERISGMFMSEQSSKCILCSLTRILLDNEICRRRCRFRRYRRF